MNDEPNFETDAKIIRGEAVNFPRRDRPVMPVTERAPPPDQVTADIVQLAKDQQRNRSEARRDACIVLSRAMARRAGQDMTAWTCDDADTAWAIAELLQLRSGQPVESLSACFSDMDRAVRK